MSIPCIHELLSHRWRGKWDRLRDWLSRVTQNADPELRWTSATSALQWVLPARLGCTSEGLCALFSSASRSSGSGPASSLGRSPIDGLHTIYWTHPTCGIIDIESAGVLELRGQERSLENTQSCGSQIACMWIPWSLSVLTPGSHPQVIDVICLECQLDIGTSHIPHNDSHVSPRLGTSDLGALQQDLQSHMPTGAEKVPWKRTAGWV